jgi:hypothetical protein
MSIEGGSDSGRGSVGRISDVINKFAPSNRACRGVDRGEDGDAGGVVDSREVGRVGGVVDVVGDGVSVAGMVSGVSTELNAVVPGNSDCASCCSSEVEPVAVGGNGSVNVSGDVGRGKRRIIVSGGVARRVDDSPRSVNGTVGAESAGQGVVSSMALSGRDKKQPVSVWSHEGGVIMGDAMDKGLDVAIVRVSGEVLRGVPCRYSSYRSGFGLSVGGHLREFRKGNARRIGWRRVEIFPNDSVILSSDFSADAESVRKGTECAVNQVCERGLEEGGDSVKKKALSAKTAYRRDFDVGHFLYEVDSLKPLGARIRVENMLSPKVKDVLNILKDREPGLVRFLIAVLGLGNMGELAVRSAVGALAVEKSFSPDLKWRYFDMSVDAANIALSRCVPSTETKELGTTFMDHGVVIQVRKVEGSENNGCMFLPDLQEGTPGCRGALFEWHSQVRDSVLPQLDVRNHKLLVDALLFQYCGVPIEKLVMFYSKGTIINAIESANRRLAALGVRVILNNGFAVLAKIGEAAVLLADDCMDAKEYIDRFSWEVSGHVEEARRLYRSGLEEKISRKRSSVSERTRVRIVNEAIRGFVKTSKDVRQSDERVRALVDAFVSDKKEVYGFGGCESAEVGSQPNWIEVIEELTLELCELHELAQDVGFSGVFGDVSRHGCYYHGQLLILALIGQYHGVFRADVEKLPFNFKKNGDSDLDVVIEKVNSAIGEDGMRVYMRGGVLFLGCDVTGENSDGKKVQIVGKGLPGRKYPRHHILQLLRRIDGKGGEAEEEKDTEVRALVLECNEAEDDALQLELELP